MNVEHLILDENNKEQKYFIPDCIPLFHDNDSVNNVGLINFFKATRLLLTVKKGYDYFISNTLDKRFNEFGDIRINLVNIDNSLDNKLMVTIRLLD